MGTFVNRIIYELMQHSDTKLVFRMLTQAELPKSLLEITERKGEMRLRRNRMVKECAGLLLKANSTGNGGGTVPNQNPSVRRNVPSNQGGPSAGPTSSISSLTTKDGPLSLNQNLNPRSNLNNSLILNNNSVSGPGDQLSSAGSDGHVLATGVPDNPAPSLLSSPQELDSSGAEASKSSVDMGNSSNVNVNAVSSSSDVDSSAPGGPGGGEPEAKRRKI